VHFSKFARWKQIPSTKTPSASNLRVFSSLRQVADGTLEITYITFIAIFLGNWLVGKRKNDKIAKSWGQNFQNLFGSNFAKFGESERFGIIKESSSTFSVTASGGRARCIGAVFTLDLTKRHDLTSYFTSLFSNKRDTLTVDIAMHSHQPFCFGLAKKREEKQMLKNYKEVAEFGVLAKIPARLSPTYVLYTDSPEIGESIFTKEIIDTLVANEAYFSSIGYTDRSQTYLQYKTIMRIVYRLPPVEEMRKLSDLMRMVFLLMESVSNVQISKNALAKNEALRKKAGATQDKSEHELRQELAQKKKLEKKAAERATYEKMTPEQQQKWDEKEAKRKLKAKQSKVKVVYS